MGAEMRILLRREKDRHWSFAEAVTVKAEADLQKLLSDSPDLIPVDEIGQDLSPLVLGVREVGLPGSGNTDLLAFTADGDIAIIECKLASNPESKRKVIGQILEYAAFLWGMSYEELDDRIEARLKQGLGDLVGNAVKGDWDGEAFRKAVEAVLKDGRFALVIVVDELNDDLRRIIRFVNERGGGGFTLHALEVRRFRSGEIEVLVPHLHGAAPAISPRASRKTWTEEQFLTALGAKEGETVLALARDLLQWTKQASDRVYFGNGKGVGSFTFHLLEKGKVVSVFSVYSNARVVLNYGWLSTAVPADVMRGFHDRVVAIPSFSRVAADFGKWPSLSLPEAFGPSGALDQFKGAVGWLHEKVHPR